MKAYLETVVIAKPEGGDVSTSCSQIILEFNGWDEWDNFNETFDAHEKGPNFQIYRTLLKLW